MFMISEFFIDIIFNFVSGMLSLLPDVTWGVDSAAFSYFLDIVDVACYLLPMGTVSAILGVIVSLATFRFIISVIKTIWALLPLV